MEYLYTSSYNQIQIDSARVGNSGGEGSVHRIINSSIYPNHCVKKFYQQKRTDSKRRKIEYMIRNVPDNLKNDFFILCWPQDIVHDANRNFIGFIMPLAFGGSEKLYEFTLTPFPSKYGHAWIKFDRSNQTGRKNLYKLCCNICYAVAMIHHTNKYVFVDYKPQNILVTDEGKVSIIDMDSFQVSSTGVRLFPGDVVTLENAPPESKTLNPCTECILPNWDRFSMAVSFYQILLGIHPYAASANGQYANLGSLQEKIQNELFIYGKKYEHLTFVPPPHNLFWHLPISVRNLFMRAFDTTPSNRPTAEDWYRSFSEEIK
ncbi:MAG: hypothetical protein HY841_04055 [Bacteroidetes bacterium]|nr:hypothetical protein [Bacteroidota bacterium]